MHGEDGIGPVLLVHKLEVAALHNFQVDFIFSMSASTDHTTHISRVCSTYRAPFTSQAKAIMCSG